MEQCCCDCQYCEWDYDACIWVCTLDNEYIYDADISICSNFAKAW